MAEQNSYTDQMSGAIARAMKVAADLAQVTTDEMSNTTACVTKTAGSMAHELIEQSTDTVGKFVTPIAENPLVKYATKVPGLSWLLAALGQVDVDRVETEVARLKQEHPSDSPAELAHRIMVDTAVKAGGIGVVTNFIPPFALALFAVDLAAITALQAEMIYRIAAIYGFPLHDPARRGEVLAIYGLSVGGSGAIKTGLSFVEILPIIGPAVGASGNAALIYGLGHLACRFYESKKKTATV